MPYTVGKNKNQINLAVCTPITETDGCGNFKGGYLRLGPPHDERLAVVKQREGKSI